MLYHKSNKSNQREQNLLIGEQNFEYVKWQCLVLTYEKTLSLIYSFCYSGDQNFLKQLVAFDKDNITDRVLKKIGQYVAQTDFQPDIIGRVSAAAKSLCMWVRAMEVYGRIYRVVEPKKQRLNAAMVQLKEKQDALSEAKAKLAEVEYFI